MTPEQRDIVLLPVPFSDLTTTKRRPVLVLSTTAYNRGSADVLVAAITSNITLASAGVLIAAADVDQGTLPRTSLVRPDKVHSLSKQIIIKKYGRLAEQQFDQVLLKLDAILAR